MKKSIKDFNDLFVKNILQGHTGGFFHTYRNRQKKTWHCVYNEMEHKGIITHVTIKRPTFNLHRVSSIETGHTEI